MSRLQDIREERLREISEQRSRYTAAALAQAAGVSNPTYAKLEKHPENFTQRQQEAIAEYMGMAVEDIFLPSKVN